MNRFVDKYGCMSIYEEVGRRSRFPKYNVGDNRVAEKLEAVFYDLDKAVEYAKFHANDELVKAADTEETIPSAVEDLAFIVVGTFVLLANFMGILFFLKYLL